MAWLVCNVTGTHTFFICCPVENRDAAAPLTPGSEANYIRHYSEVQTTESTLEKQRFINKQKGCDGQLLTW